MARKAKKKSKKKKIEDQKQEEQRRQEGRWKGRQYEVKVNGGLKV